MAIAMSLLDHLKDVAERQGLAKVEEVEVEVGALQLVVPEALELAFRAATEGTIAENAELRIAELPARGACRACGHEFPLAVDDYLCPHCRTADVEIKAGNDIILASLVGRQREDRTS